MTYVLGSIGVELSQQSMRPREAAPPLPAKTLSSPMLATRQARPRSYTAPTKTTGNLVAQVAKYKGQQKQLEKLLKLIGRELAQCNAVVASAVQTRASAKTVAQAKQCARVLTKAASDCINAIKACSGKANRAAEAAVATGASLIDVKRAAESAVGRDVEVESRTAKIVPGGEIVPGDGASVVESPSVNESVDSSTPPGADVLPSPEEGAALETAAGLPLWVKAGAVLGVGYLIFRKR